MIKFTIIKSTKFTYEAVEQTSYVLGYKGRVCNFSTFNFDADEFTVDEVNKTLSITVPFEGQREEYTDQVTGEIKQGLRLLTVLPFSIH